jgi:hypothetical protein
MSDVSMPVEVIVGADGSWVVENVSGGKPGASEALQVLLGKMPEEGSFQTNAVWDWVYFPPGSLSDADRKRLLGFGSTHVEGRFSYHFREAPHVERPGAYAASMRSIHEEASSSSGKIIAAVLVLGALLVLAYIGLNGRSPAYLEGDFDGVLDASSSPHRPPGFAARLSPRFSDGDHFRIALRGDEMLHRGTNGAIVGVGSRNAYLLEGNGIGSILANILQSPDQALLFDTTRGPKSAPLLQTATGSVVAVNMQRLALGQKPEAESDYGILYNKKGTFQQGTVYAFSGALELKNGSFYLFHLPEANPAYRVEVVPQGAGMRALLAYLARSRFAVKVYGTLDSVTDPKSDARKNDRVIGAVGDNFILGLANGLYANAPDA